MTERNDSDGIRLLRGALAGLIAGTVASFAMDRFQAAVTTLSSSDDDSDAEPATERTADGIAVALTGRRLAREAKPVAGQAVHYALGIGLGVAYGIAAEFRPSVTKGFGTAFGIGTATLLDQVAVPAVGLGSPPWETALSTNIYSYASHLVFGSTTELVRRQTAATLRA